MIRDSQFLCSRDKLNTPRTAGLRSVRFWPCAEPWGYRIADNPEPGRPTMAQKIFVIEEQFFETGPRNIHQPQLCLRRGRHGATAFGNILQTGADGLHHLVGQTGTGINELFAEPDGRIIDDGSLKLQVSR